MTDLGETSLEPKRWLSTGVLKRGRDPKRPPTRRRGKNDTRQSLCAPTENGFGQRFTKQKLCVLRTAEGKVAFNRRVKAWADGE